MGADISRVIGVFPFITFNDVQPLNDLIVELTRGNYYGKKELQPILEALGQNDTAIGEQITILGQNDESIMAKINAMKVQLQTLVAQVAEKDERIAELEQGGGANPLSRFLSKSVMQEQVQLF